MPGFLRADEVSARRMGNRRGFLSMRGLRVVGDKPNGLRSSGFLLSVSDFLLEKIKMTLTSGQFSGMVGRGGFSSLMSSGSGGPGRKCLVGRNARGWG